MEINGHQYYHFGRWENYIDQQRYVRYDSLGNLLCYDNGKDSVLYYLSLGSQDTVKFSLGIETFYVTASKYSDTLYTRAGNFSDIIVLRLGTIEYPDFHKEIYFAKNVGIIFDKHDCDENFDRWLFYAKINGVEYPTSGIEPNPTTLEKYTLKLENYPNPFNQSTTISYSLPTDGDIKLSVFDINGKCVDNLFNGKQRAGSYHFIWNGRSASSGVYLIRLRTENNVVTHKCLLVK